MSCEYAAEHLRGAIKALESDDVLKSLSEVAEALKLVFESGEIAELALTPYDEIPHQLMSLVDAVESA